MTKVPYLKVSHDQSSFSQGECHMTRVPSPKVSEDLMFGAGNKLYPFMLTILRLFDTSCTSNIRFSDCSKMVTPVELLLACICILKALALPGYNYSY